MKQTGFFLLRLSMGVNMLFHAVNRFYYGYNNFKSWMVTEFTPTFMPGFITSVFALIFPYAEGLVGISLILGLKTKWGLMAGSLIISFLIIDSCLINQWDWVGLQMVYAICFYLLFEKYEENNWTIDNLLKSK